ncbi:hypothetical protein BC938DRAFT_471371 [Jimgerdemannia flammicorona]|uniref:Uncharacterized protein n=1 Tax=Jimgerdemannia flammicorona TaxID=994334 RepID=A0A433Q891_9FUNG|nr:hypothetical protein BC938DRAFT_471371 [Jimgerdemannia flammicorona]
MFAGDELAFSRASLFREEPAVRLRKAAIEGNVHAVKRLIKKVPNMQDRSYVRRAVRARRARKLFTRKRARG